MARDATWQKFSTVSQKIPYQDRIPQRRVQRLPDNYTGGSWPANTVTRYRYMPFAGTELENPINLQVHNLSYADFVRHYCYSTCKASLEVRNSSEPSYIGFDLVKAEAVHKPYNDGHVGTIRRIDSYRLRYCRTVSFHGVQTPLRIRWQTFRANLPD